jgi:3-dehydroquinate dehydratase
MSQSIADMLNDKSREQMKSLINTNKTIAELRPGEKADGFYLIKYYEVKKTTNGKQYIDIDLVDKTDDSKEPPEEEIFISADFDDTKTPPQQEKIARNEKQIQKPIRIRQKRRRYKQKDS